MIIVVTKNSLLNEWPNKHLKILQGWAGCIRLRYKPVPDKVRSNFNQIRQVLLTEVTVLSVRKICPEFEACFIHSYSRRTIQLLSKMILTYQIIRLALLDHLGYHRSLILKTSL